MSTNTRHLSFLIQGVPSQRVRVLQVRCYFIYILNRRHYLIQRGGGEEEDLREDLEHAVVMVELYLVILQASLLCTTSLVIMAYPVDRIQLEDSLEIDL